MDAPSIPNPTFYEKGDDGLIRLYDMVTGKVLQVLSGDSYASRAPIEFTEVSGVLVQKNVNIEGKNLEARVQYRQLVGDLICQEVSNGTALKLVLEKMNIKYRTVCDWRRTNPEFNEALNLAYQDRADFLADRALQEAESAVATPGGAAKAKLIVDTLWKSAEVANGKKYSPKIKADGNVVVPIQVIIETGIRRAGDPGFIADETAKIREVKEAVPSVEAAIDSSELQGKAGHE
jgi:hypothetical protein